MLNFDQICFCFKSTILARKKKELPVIEQVEITDVAAEGKAIARIDDLVVLFRLPLPEILSICNYIEKNIVMLKGGY